MPKITFIGAGSFGFTRTLVRDLLTFPTLEASEIALMDIDAERLDFAKRAVTRIVEAGEYPATVTSTMDRQLLDTLALEAGGQAIYPVDAADAAVTARKMLRALSVRHAGDAGVLAGVDPGRAAMLSGIVWLMAAILLHGGRCWQVAGKNVKFSSGPEGFQEV